MAFKLHTLPYPYSIWYCKNEAEFVELKKKLKWDGDYPYPKDHIKGSVTYRDNIGIVCFNHQGTKDIWSMLETIVHETTHLVQMLWYYVGEENPGREAEAYLTEMIFGQLVFLQRKYDPVFRKALNGMVPARRERTGKATPAADGAVVSTNAGDTLPDNS